MSDRSDTLLSPGQAGDTVLLVGHGSRDPQGVEQYHAFAAALQARLGVPVRPAFLEFNDPAVLDGIGRCVADGARRLTVMPLFLGAATHQKNDVPAAINRARRLYPQLSVVYGTPLGTHATLAEAANACAEAALAAADQPIDDGAMVLLVGRGSRDPDSNGDLHKIARLLYEGRSYQSVEACYIAIATPDLAGGIERCARLGARRVAVVPYMLFTGVLVKRIDELLAAERRQRPGLTLVAAQPLGLQPGLLDVVEQRIAEAIAGEAHGNCDTCKYRLHLTGFESEYLLPQGSDHHHGLRVSG